METEGAPKVENGGAGANGAEQRRDELVQRLFMAAIGTWDIAGVYLGDRLGLYRALADSGASTPAALATETGLSERYVREWLEQQAASGVLAAEGAGEGAEEIRYSIPAGHDEVLLDETSLNYAAPFGRLVFGCLKPIDAVLEAFRTGEGVPYEAYGADLHGGQARFTRPMFENLLASEWLGSIPDVRERLSSEPPARVADVACGEGYSTMAIARGYPRARVDGIDLDRASIEAARAHLKAEPELADRVGFHLRDAADEELAGSYDLVYIHEALHDMSRPVDVLAKCRGLLAEGGTVIVGDERVPDRFDPPGDELERFYYGCSVTHCLPVGMIGAEPAGTGTVMRAPTVERYAREAGFGGFEVLPIEDDFYRFYRLDP